MPDRLQAAVAGVKQVWPAVFASTMTTVLVFIPVAFVQQEAGQLYSDVAIAISAAILASMAVAVTALPTATARLDFGSRAQDSGVAQPAKKHRARDATLGLVNSLLATPARRMACVGMTVLISGLVIWQLTPAAEYLPEGEEPKVFAVMSPPPGYNLAAMAEIGKEIEDYFNAHVGADPDLFHSGQSDVPAIAYVNMRIGSDQVRIISEPVEAGDIEDLMDAITRKYREYPGMRAFAARGSIITSNDGGTRSINLDIAGPDLAGIYQVALAAYRRAGEVFDNPRLQSQPSSLALSQPMVEIRPQWERAAELGMTADDLGFTVSALTDGSYVDEFFLADDKIDIYLYSQAGQNASLDALAQLPVYTRAGEVIPLGSLVDIRETVDTSSVRRVNGRRTVTLSIIPPRDVPLETGVTRVREEVLEYLRERGEIPADVNIAISGAADQLDATREALVVKLRDCPAGHLPGYGGHLQSLGLPATDHDVDTAGHRRRHCRALVAQRHWQPAAAGGAHADCAAL